jgi:hypothetical protein
MKTIRINFILDLGLFLAFLSLAATGAALKWAVPGHCGGSEGGTRFFLGLHRHSWMDLHFYMAVVLVVFILVHLVLHWDWIVRRFKPSPAG